MEIIKDNFGSYWLLINGKGCIALFKRCEGQTKQKMRNEGFFLFTTEPEELWVEDEELPAIRKWKNTLWYR